MAVRAKDKSATPARSRNKRAAARETRRKKDRQRRIIYAIAGVVAVVLVGALIARAIVTPSPGQAVPSLGNAHVDESQVGLMTYNSIPPTSGPHLGRLASWGIHAEPIPNELQVHNLEDGGVMVQYSCPEGCDELVSQLTSIVNQYSDSVILAPYLDMDSRIALTAWGRIDTFDQFDENRIERFIKAYRGIDHHRG